MRKILLSLCSLLVCSFCFGAGCDMDQTTFRCALVTEIYDADTFTVLLPNVPEFLRKLSIRVRGIDAAEIKGTHRCEKKVAQTARVALVGIMPIGSMVTISNVKWDKYGGRVLGDVRIGETDLATFMLSNGLANPYDGKKKKKTDWCKPLPPWTAPIKEN